MDRSNEIENLRFMINDLRESVYNLKIFDRQGEINQYCDELTSRVTLAVDSAVKHLNKLQQDLIEEIDKYRAEQLDTVKLANNSQSNVDSKQDAPQRELEKLAREIESSYSQWETHLVQASPGEVTLRECFDHVNTHKKSVSELAKRMRHHAFNGRFMRFSPNGLFLLENGHIGEMQIIQHEAFDELIENIQLDKCDSKARTFQIGPAKKHFCSVVGELDITAMLFLSNGHLLVCPAFNPIQVWDVQKMEPLGEIDCTRSSIFWSLTELPNGNVAAGQKYNRLNLWDLRRNKLVKRIDITEMDIVSLKTLPTGNLVGLSESSDIIIWDPRQSEGNCRLFKIPVCSEIRRTSLELLSNGFLAFSTRENECERIRILDTLTGKIVKDLPTNHKNVSQICVLANDEIVVSSDEGVIRLLNLADDDFSFTWDSSHFGKIVKVTKLPNNQIRVVHLKDQRLPAMTPTILSSEDQVYVSLSSSISADGEDVAFGTMNGKLSIWHLSESPSSFDHQTKFL